MTKKYKAKSQIALNVVLGTGKSVHVSFSAQTGGGSIYYTDNKELQNALERHPKFGRLFKRDDSEPVAVSAPAEAPSVDDAGAGGLKEMSFACLDDAKDFLVDRYGMSRTKLRSQSAIEEAGRQEGYAFVIG